MIEFNADWGGDNASSYVSLEDAEAIASLILPSSTAWSAASDAAKTAALISATASIDSLTFVGAPYYTTQALAWPRLLSTSWRYRYANLATLSDDRFQSITKRDIEVATVLQAEHVLRTGSGQSHQQLIADGVKQVSKSVGPVR
jgi:hypothetical protein